MESVYFGLFVLLIAWIVVWSIKNDRAGSIAAQKGLFSMRPPAAEADKQEPAAKGLGPADYVRGDAGTAGNAGDNAAKG